MLTLRYMEWYALATCHYIRNCIENNFLSHRSEFRETISIPQISRPHIEITWIWRPPTRSPQLRTPQVGRPQIGRTQTVRPHNEGSQSGVPQPGMPPIMVPLIVFLQEDDLQMGHHTSKHAKSDASANGTSKYIQRKKNMEQNHNERKHKQVGH